MGPNMRISSGLPPEALDRAPTVLLDVLRQAEARRLGTSAGSITGATIQYVNVPRHLQGGLGGGVRRVTYLATESGQLRIIIEGRTRIGASKLRDINALLPVSEVFGPNSGMERVHLWGKVLGDSVRAGVVYGPEQLNDAMESLEDIVMARGLARMESADVTVSAIVEMRPIHGEKQPILRRATYQWTDAGTPYAFSAGIDDTTGAVYLRAGLGEGEDLPLRLGSLRRRR